MQIRTSVLGSNSDRCTVALKTEAERHLDWLASKREARRKLLQTLAELNNGFVHPQHQLYWTAGKPEAMLITWAYTQDLLSDRDKRTLMML